MPRRLCKIFLLFKFVRIRFQVHDSHDRNQNPYPPHTPTTHTHTHTHTHTQNGSFNTFYDNQSHSARFGLTRARVVAVAMSTNDLIKAASADPDTPVTLDHVTNYEWMMEAMQDMMKAMGEETPVRSRVKNL